MIEQQPYIVCPKCGMVSHNPNDVRERYCGNCHAFHDDLVRDAGLVKVHNSSNEPRFEDPRYQRRIVESHRPIAIVENMHDVKLECGHSPLVFCTPDPQVGQLMFCPGCAYPTEEA